MVKLGLPEHMREKGSSTHMGLLLHWTFGEVVPPCEQARIHAKRLLGETPSVSIPYPPKPLTTWWFIVAGINLGSGFLDFRGSSQHCSHC